MGNSGVVSGDAGAGFDISGATGVAYMSFDDFLGSAGFEAEFFSINLATGVATQIGPDDPFNLLDFSIRPVAVAVSAPGSMVLSLAALGWLGVAARRRKPRA